jgi:alkylation response protein AidB-like acyl-CoA dehydrogenase
MAAEPRSVGVSGAQDQWGYRDELVPHLIERVRALRPMLQANAVKGEQQRTPTEEVVNALLELNLFAQITPVRWGGLGLSSTALARINGEVAKGDPAVAWVLQILNGTTWVASLTSDALQEELFGSGLPRVCSAVTPPGTAVPVEGGYIVNGKWPYCSGSRQATWAQLGVTRMNADGTKSPGCMAYIPMSKITIEDTWFNVGMQGTGSDTCVAKDVFVAEKCFVPIEKSYNYVEPGKRHYGAPSDYWPLMSLLRSAGMGQLVGAAEAMLEKVLEAAKTRPIVTTIYARQADSHVYQRELGEISTKLRAARLLIEDTTGALDAAGLARQAMTVAERAQSKGQGALAIELIHQSVEKLMFLSGSSAFFHSNELSRYWRDISTALRHVINLPHLGYEVHGRSLLGVQPNIVIADAF